MLIKNIRFWATMTVAIFLLSLGIACKKNEDEAQKDNGPSQAGSKYQTSGNEGSIAGKITANGTVPEAKKIDMGADSVCAKNSNATTQDWAVKDGKVEYTFVYIKDGQTADGKKIGDLTFGPATNPVVLDQNGCQYKPHVLGLQAGQELDVKNSDDTTHNIHPTPRVNSEWNQSQTKGAADIKQKFTRPEVMIPVKCNQHPWMKAYIGVVKHPFFAVSGADGTYEIKGVPPGTYTVVAWHEKGNAGDEKTMQVTVPSKGKGTADFAFDTAATASIQARSLQVLPAIEIPMLGHH